MYTEFKQLRHLTLSAALALGLVGITGTAQAKWSNCNSANRSVSSNSYNQFHSRMTISHVQRVLRRDGYYHGRIDGLDGPATHAALRHFQRDNGLAITGRLTPRTMSTLGVPVSGQASRSQNLNNNQNSGAYGYNSNMQPQQSQNSMPGQNNMPANQASGNQNNTAFRENNMNGTAMQQPSSTVRTVQRDLLQRGFYSGAVNGILGPQTREAIRKFQRTNNLNDTGRLDQQTLSRLGVD